MQDILSWFGHSGERLDTVGGFTVIECAKCRFKHIVPIPTPAELENVYRHEYYTADKPFYIERHREDLDWWNLAYADRYDAFEAQLPGSRRRMLDVGSGPGYFLLHGKRRGWIVTGIEPSSRAAAHARTLGVDVMEVFLTEDVAHTLGEFDVVHMSEVLEHIPDPMTFLAAVKQVLAPNGLICVVVPNDYSPFQQALRSACGYAPWWAAPPHHINYFDFESLAGLLDRSGFDIIMSEASFPIDMFLLMGENYIGDDRRGRACHQMRKQFELNLARAGMNDTRRRLYRDMAKLGIGREAMVVGRLRARSAEE